MRGGAIGPQRLIHTSELQRVHRERVTVQGEGRSAGDHQAAARAQSRRTPRRQGTGVNGRRAAVGIRATQDYRARAVLSHRTAARNRARVRQDIRPIENHCAVVGHRPHDRPSQARRSELQRAPAGHRGAAGIRIGPGQDEGARAHHFEPAEPIAGAQR